jgi:hypothetical protein
MGRSQPVSKRLTTKKWRDMTVEEWDKWWDERVKGVNFNNHEESYNFHMNSPDCLICGEIPTHWIPAKDDGWLMPACDKHFNNPKITEKRWAKARAIREEIAEEMADLKCCKCGGMPVTTFIDPIITLDFATPDNTAPLGLPLCDKCSLSDEFQEEYEAACLREAHNKRQELTGRTEFKFEIGDIGQTVKLQRKISKTPDESFISFMWDCFARHCLCDWGNISQEDREKNNQALQAKGELLSIYKHDKYPTICIFTEANGAQTVIGLQGEFH